ncbi:hypothetical protein HDE_14355 [Halotydeus destructor]|nr:hypothetical protein HDE_14355 [Halotydeus destructor]
MSKPETFFSYFLILTIVFAVSYSLPTDLPDLDHDDHSSHQLFRSPRSARGSWWTTISRCVKSKLSSDTTENRTFRCVAQKMKEVFRMTARGTCKNCQLYFYCLANLRARDGCNHGQVADDSLAITDCQVANEHGLTIDVTEASEFGRNGGNCDQLYLCSTGCRYDPENMTCTATCH